MNMLVEIAGKFYAHAPFAALFLGVLLIALAVLMIYSAISHWCTSLKSSGQRSNKLQKYAMVVEWQNAGEAMAAWAWPTETGREVAELQEFVVGYQTKKLVGTLMVSALGCAIMAGFGLSTLPYIAEDFVTGKVFLLILAPCIPAIYCAWIAWRSIARIWRQSKGLPAYRLTTKFIEIGDRRFLWDDLKGIGRVMSIGPNGEKLDKLMLWLPNKNTLDLDVGALSSHPNHLGMMLERFWHGHQRMEVLNYALSLSRIAGFMLPLRNIRPVEWQVSNTVSAGILHMAEIGIIVPTISAGIVFLVDDQPSGSMIALCSDAGDAADIDDPDPLWLRIKLGDITRNLLSRICRIIANTYSQIEGPSVLTQGTHEIKQAPVVVLSTVLWVSELVLDGINLQNIKPDDKFVFSVCMDSRLLEALSLLETAHVDGRGEYPTYLEHEIVTAYDAFTKSQHPSA